MAGVGALTARSAVAARSPRTQQVPPLLVRCGLAPPLVRPGPERDRGGWPAVVPQALPQCPVFAGGGPVVGEVRRRPPGRLLEDGVD